MLDKLDGRVPATGTNQPLAPVKIETSNVSTDGSVTSPSQNTSETAPGNPIGSLQVQISIPDFKNSNLKKF
jgi:hypothetical protein